MINYGMRNMTYPAYGTDFTQEQLNRALGLMKEAVQDERADEMRYDYLISVAPTQEEKDIITSIRNDERNHRQWYREMYKAYTGQNIESTNGETFVKPASYLDGISKAIFGELGAMEKYRFIREGLPSRYYRDVVLRILTDEMKHATKYNYILNKNALGMSSRQNTPITSNIGSQIPSTTAQKPSTATQAPGTTTQKPGTTTQAPGTTTQKPGTTTQKPGTTTQAPGTTTQKPGTTTQAPGTTTQAPGTTTQAPGTTTQAPGTTTQAPSNIASEMLGSMLPQTLSEWGPYINPIVQQALSEIQKGANIQQVLQKYILAGVSIGFGETPQQVMQAITGAKEGGESKPATQSSMNRYQSIYR